MILTLYDLLFNSLYFCSSHIMVETIAHYAEYYDFRTLLQTKVFLPIKRAVKKMTKCTNGYLNSLALWYHFVYNIRSHNSTTKYSESIRDTKI